MLLIFIFSFFVFGNCEVCKEPECGATRETTSDSAGRSASPYNRPPAVPQRYGALQAHDLNQLQRIKYLTNQLGVVLLRGSKQEIDDAIAVAKEIRTRIRKWREDVENDIVAFPAQLGSRVALPDGRISAQDPKSSTVVTSVYEVIELVEAVIFRTRRLKRFGAEIERAIDRSRSDDDIVIIVRQLTADISSLVQRVVDSVLEYDPNRLTLHHVLVAMYCETTSANDALKRINDDISLGLIADALLEKLLERWSSEPSQPSRIIKQNLAIHSLVDKALTDLQSVMTADREGDEDTKNALINAVRTATIDINEGVQDIAAAVTTTDSYFPVNKDIELTISGRMLSINVILKSFGFEEQLVPYPRLLDVLGSMSSVEPEFNFAAKILESVAICEELAHGIIDEFSAELVALLKQRIALLDLWILMANEERLHYAPDRLLIPKDATIVQNIVNSWIGALGVSIAEINNRNPEQDPIAFSDIRLLLNYQVTAIDGQRIRYDFAK